MQHKKTEEQVEKAIKEAAKDQNEETAEKNSINENKELQEKIEELTDTLQRVQADFINYKNRAEKEKAGCIEYASYALIKKLLPVIDSFEMALKETPEKHSTGNVDYKKTYIEFMKGIKMIYAQLVDVLASEGLRPLEAMGEKFDPYRHEVLMKGKSDIEEDTIIGEFLKGYALKDKILRHSKVMISEPPLQEGEETQSDGKKEEKNAGDE